MKLTENNLPYPAYVLSRIARLRKKRRLSQRRVARCLGVTQQTYSEYERGLSRMHIDEFMRLAALYDVSLDYITGASSIITEFPRY